MQIVVSLRHFHLRHVQYKLSLINPQRRNLNSECVLWYDVRLGTQGNRPRKLIKCMEVSLYYSDLNFRQWENKTRESSELASLLYYSGPGSVVGIATAYGLDGPGIEFRWGETFRTSPDRPCGPPSLLYNGYRVFPGGKVLPGRDADPSPPSSAEV